MISTLLSSKLLIRSSLSSNLLKIPYSVFFHFNYYVFLSALIGSLFISFISLLKFSLLSCILPLILIFLWPLLWTLFPHFIRAFFLSFYLNLSLWTYSLSPHLTFCVCFSELDGTANCPECKGMASCKNIAGVDVCVPGGLGGLAGTGAGADHWCPRTCCVRATLSGQLELERGWARAVLWRAIQGPPWQDDWRWGGPGAC